MDTVGGRTKEGFMHNMDEIQHRLEFLEKCMKESKEAQKRYRDLLDSVPDALIFVNRSQEIVLVNVQTERLFGYKQEELEGKRLDILIPARYREKHFNDVSGFFLNPRLRLMGSGLKIYAVKKDGTEFRADISLSPLRTEGDVMVTAAVRDISDRVKEQEQIERNYHIQSVINSLLKISMGPDPFHDKMERVLDIVLSVPHLALNPRGSIYLVVGESKHLVLQAERGMTDIEKSTCGKIPFMKCLCCPAVSTCNLENPECNEAGFGILFEDLPGCGHYCIPITSGERPLGIINIFVKGRHKRDTSEESFLSTVADTIAGMIERHWAEVEKERLREKLLQTEKLAALGRVAANVAHEIRNPLTSVGGFARRLQKRIQEGTKERNYTDFIVSEVDILENILQGVLSYSRAFVPWTEEHDIHEPIEAVLMLYEEKCIRNSIEIRRSFSRLPEVEIDKEQVLEVMGNIVLNAIDAMPGGGTLTIATAEEEINDLVHVTVSIKDTGQGIPPGMMDKIFEPFFTTKVERRGTGLGLPISKRIMEDHGGNITVESTIGKGTTFRLYFPVKTDR